VLYFFCARLADLSASISYLHTHLLCQCPQVQAILTVKPPLPRCPIEVDLFPLKELETRLVSALHLTFMISVSFLCKLRKFVSEPGATSLYGYMSGPSLDGRQDYFFFLTSSKFEDMELYQARNQIALHFGRLQKVSLIHSKGLKRIIRRSNHFLWDMLCAFTVTYHRLSNPANWNKLIFAFLPV